MSDPSPDLSSCLSVCDPQSFDVMRLDYIPSLRTRLLHLLVQYGVNELPSPIHSDTITATTGIDEVCYSIYEREF